LFFPEKILYLAVMIFLAKRKAAIVLLTMLCVMACDDEPAKKSANTFIDSRDGKNYKTVKIGSQTWMAENLNYVASDSKCYDNDESNCQKYGRLYNWDAAMKACPSGWHLPTQAEWEEMAAYIGGEVAGGKKLKTTSGWNDYQGKSGNGTDEFGFSALPSGLGDPSGNFLNAEYYSYWWSASEYDSGNAYNRSMNGSGARLYWHNRKKPFLFSVRCLQD
jgi:uncharacterized protein (TIGR02145 family)